MSKTKNEKRGRNYGTAAGLAVGGAPGAAVGRYGGEAVGGMFDDDDPGYGRYYEPISENDADYEEDVQENQGVAPYMMQNLKDRWGVEQGSAERGDDIYPMAMRPAYRRADRYEDRSERRYRRTRDQEKALNNAGLSRMADVAGNRKDAEAGRARYYSEWEPGARFDEGAAIDDGYLEWLFGGDK